MNLTTAGMIALGLAVYGAVAYAVGSILQAVGAKRSSGTVSTLGHPLYLIGIVLDISAWVAAMFALQQLAVYVVESVLAGSLAITALAAWLFLRSHLRRRDVLAIICTSVALTVLACSAGRQAEMPMTNDMRLGFCTAAFVVVILGWTAVRVGVPGLIAAIGGLSLGTAALNGRALHFPPGTMDHWTTAALTIATEPLVWTLLIFPVNGMILYANALQQGDVGRVTAVHWIGEVTVPSVIALTILGDTVRPGWETAAMVAGVITICSAVVLASAPAATAPADAVPAALPTGAMPAALAAGTVPAALPSGTVPAALAAGAVRPALGATYARSGAALVPAQAAAGLALMQAEAWRLAIPPEAYWPALQPPLVRGYGTFLWWGSPQSSQALWVPPDRTLTPPGAVPAWAGPQLPESRPAPASPAGLRRARSLPGSRRSAGALPAPRSAGRHAA
ncbi:hypothetical protein [Actinoplanes sp. NBRC 101535]|uniref:hypothetical protein n=1 Tax=Actinoplanes sp. NBRC 101535 TaxID=3032196 RepID=UPI0024A06D60|nr:hypothetical protein [Actinoplanes sp. NBRC 101535]GLX99752.1 hypothetical protein Acsp01_01320 [Actinoplanes sp. NBRC 101535]